MATELDRARRRRHGEANYRLCRYADDFVVLVSGTKAHAEACETRWQRCLSRWAFACRKKRRRLSTSTRGSTSSASASSGRRKRGSNKTFVYTLPSKKALASIKAKVKAITRQGTNKPLTDLLRQLNPALRGWTTYFRHGVSKATFGYLSHYTWRRVIRLAPPQAPPCHLEAAATALPRQRVVAEQDGVTLFNPATVPVTRYRYRGASDPLAVGRDG